MDMETYQDLAADEPNEVPEASFATISEIFEDGVTLLFDGLDAPTTKRYKVNAFVVFQPGDRVRVIKDSGTYVVEYPVGNPRTEFKADNATNADHATTADTATSADHATTADSASQVTGAISYASRSGSAQNVFANGYTNRQRIWLDYSGGKFYIAVENGPRRRIG